MMTFDDFCNLPEEDIMQLTPSSMIFAAGGTRRAALLAGIQEQDEYVKWSAEQLITSFGLFAKYGIRHIVTHAIVPTQWEEVTPGYREKLTGWVAGTLTQQKTIEAYQERGWRETMIGTDALPEFQPVREKLLNIFPQEHDYTLSVHYVATPSYDSHWKKMAELLSEDWHTQNDLILGQYKENIPPIKLYVGYGKPVMSAAVCPPLLGAFDGMHCYWLQKPGFVTSIKSVLAILYDYAFTRKTWLRDKSERTAQVLIHKKEISQENILGLGKRLGPFWYPEQKVGK